jgi:signal transduction histidine kinase
MSSQQELIEGLLQFVALAESERKLLAADLHDQTLSDLRKLALLARKVLDERWGPLPEQMREAIVQIVTGLDAAMDEVRRAMENLSPSALDTLGLIPALESCLTRSASCEQSFLTRFACTVREEQIMLSDVERLMLYRIIQEALNNICKHAGARSVELGVRLDRGELVVSVVDDGRGMGVSGDLGRARGLENMRFRARLVGATLTWGKPPDRRGTFLEVRLRMGQG